MNLKCITVDDEPLSLTKIRGFITQVPYLDLVSEFSSALPAMAFLKENPVDLIFLDIQMDNLTGIQMLEVLENRPAVILTTAFDQYALKGYELNVSDYLLKPYSFERFLKAVEKVHSQMLHISNKENPSYIFVKSEYRLEKVNFADILFVESRGDYMYLVLNQARIMTLMTMKSLCGLLPADDFMRIHKSWVVSINRIDAVEYGFVRIKDHKIPIGDSYREEVKKRLNI